jgi:phenylpropionate dioxygenase-like ring-hydroxylating dioxygenase large terminal subunit
MNKPADIAKEMAQQSVSFGVEPFISEAYARAEADKLWPKVWQHACRLEDIPNVGDYVTYDILNDTILIVRSEPDKISAFYNVCAHRGRRLASGCGHVTQFRCSYHAWRYNLKGENIYVLDRDDWDGVLTPERLNLPHVKIDTWGGWVWINMDPGCEPLRDYLEPLASMLDPFAFDKMRYRWRQWCYFDCNWKTAIEAFVEAYHVEGTHPQLMKLADFYTWSQADGRHSHKGFKERNPELAVSESNTITRPGKGDDARISIAKLQEEIYRTVNASTTKTFVDAAARLADELPEGTPAAKVMAHWIESARRDDAARGVVWPAIEPEHLAKSGNSCHFFPNLAIGHGITFALCYRARPHGYDPNKCIFEASFMERYPEGKEPKTEWVYAEPADVGKWRSVLVQDFANMNEVQKGMRSRGFRGALPNPKQEQPVSNFQRNLAIYMGTGGLRPLD